MAMRPSTAPCKGCEDRKVGCHAACLRYLDWKEKTNMAKTPMRNESIVIGMLAEGAVKGKKYAQKVSGRKIVVK